MRWKWLKLWQFIVEVKGSILNGVGRKSDGWNRRYSHYFEPCKLSVWEMEKRKYLKNHALEVSEILICCSPEWDENFEWSLTKIGWLEAELELKRWKWQKQMYLGNHALEMSDVLICCRGIQELHFEWSTTRIGWLGAEKTTLLWTTLSHC